MVCSNSNQLIGKCVTAMFLYSDKYTHICEWYNEKPTIRNCFANVHIFTSNEFLKRKKNQWNIFQAKNTSINLKGNLVSIYFVDQKLEWHS